MDDWLVANPGKPLGVGGRAMLQRMNRSHRPLRDWGFAFLDWRPGMRILDVGCGGGAAIGEMLKLSPESRIDGVDYSPESVALAQAENQAAGERVRIQAGDVSALPYSEAQFDRVTAIETVYFWPELSAGLDEIYRVLKPGGDLAVLCEVDGPERMDWDKVNFSLRVYRPAELSGFLERARFQNIRCETGETGYLFLSAIK